MINRKLLLDMLNLIKPAVSTQDFIPILSYFKIEQGRIMAFNDIHAIIIDCKENDIGLDAEINCCVPAELLIKTLSTMSSDQISFTMSDKDGKLIVANGDGKKASKVKIPFLPADSFPFSFEKYVEKPAVSMENEVQLDRETIEGMQQCLIAVGKNAAHPEHMGVTLDPHFSDDEAALYSTDNVSISRFTFASSAKMRAVEKPLVLPAEFCKQISVMLKSKSIKYNDGTVWIEIYPNYFLAMVGLVTLFSRRIDDAKITKFSETVSRYWKEGSQLFDIPADFSDAIERAAMLAGHEGTFMKIMDGELSMETHSERGDANETMNYTGKSSEFWINPSLVKRMLPLAKRTALMHNVLVLVNSDATFLHLIGHLQRR